MDSAQKIGHWKVVDSRHWTLDSIENEQKIGQSPADSNWTVKFRSTLCALLLMKNFIYCSVRPTVGCPLSTVHYLLSAVHCPLSNFFCPKTFSSSFSEDSGQWTKTVKSSPGQGGVLCYPGYICWKNSMHSKDKCSYSKEKKFYFSKSTNPKNKGGANDL